MKRFTLRERDILPVGTAAGLTEEEAAAFAQLHPALPAGTLNWEHRAIRFGPFCGVLRAGVVTVELLPKIDDGLDQDDSARGLLVAMLRATGTLTVSKAGAASLSQQRMHLLDLFILDFCERVHSALRAGAIACYQQQSDNLHALRGRLLLTEHLRLNAFDQSRLFCSFDERTINNRHNRALKAVLSHLLPLSISVRTKAAVAALLHRFDVVTQCKVSVSYIDQLPFDRMITRWEPVFARAKWLLQGLFPDVRAGQVDGTCLLFNMERLFETLLGLKIRRAWQDPAVGSYRIELQGPRRHLAESDAGLEFALRPDISVWGDDRIIARASRSRRQGHRRGALGRESQRRP
jgi:5-methylcytosine-specific restriction enzyme subunit McrC